MRTQTTGSVGPSRAAIVRCCDERRSGLDHLSFAVATRDDVVELARWVGAHEDVDAVVNDTAQATVLVLRDQDGIQIEICSWKTQDSG